MRTDTLTAAHGIEARSGARAPGSRLQHYLALAGLPFLAWQAWNWVAWLASGPEPVTRYRDADSASWVAARVFEVLIVVASVAIGVFVVRGCRRAGRLTFDGQLVIASALLVWWDPITDFYQPLFLYSSNWTNLNTWCSQTPFVVNVECGRLPEPMIFIPLVYTFGFLGCCLIVNAVMRGVARRRPQIRAGALLAIGLLGAMLVYLIMDSAMIRLDLWKWAGYPDATSLFAGENKVPLPMALAALNFLGAIAATRYFKDDHGRTFLERGLEHLAPKQRTRLSLLALVGFTQVMFAITIVLTIIPGPYSSPWPEYPAHLINDLCDNGTVQGTAYGPCPGDPGYLAPLRGVPSS